MLGTPKDVKEIEKQKFFFKKKIFDAWNIIDIDKKGYVDQKEVSYLMRYLLQYPNELDIAD